MNFVRLLPVIFSSLLLSAHFSRSGIDGLAIVFLVLPFLLFIKRAWVAWLFQVVLVGGAIVWIETTFRLVKTRQMLGESWTRLAIILGAVALFTLLSGLVFESKSLKERFKKKA